MAARNYMILFVLSLAVISTVAFFEASPGYMDAEYYYSDGLQIARGNGFNENFVWNYLDDPKGVPHPANTYWMPLASLLAAILPALTGQLTFTLARIPFILLGAAVSPVTAALAYRLTKNKDQAILSGALAALPGYYLAYLPTTDTFGAYMLLGAGFLALAASLTRPIRPASYPSYGLLGIIAGLLHLARADGLLWLVFGLLLLLGWSRIWEVPPNTGAARQAWKGSLILAGAEASLLAGYLLVMAPWWLRNLGVYGQLMVPGVSRTLWEREYNELFSFPAGRLTFASWWAQGIVPIMQARWDALLANLKSAAGVEGEILLLPFILIGLWEYRRDWLVRFAAAGWVAILLVMSFVYPFAGARGGFFHSSAALQPVFWAAAAAGFTKAVRWAGKKRGWTFEKALKGFSHELLVGLMLLTGFLGYLHVVGPDITNPTWNRGNAYYQRVESLLLELDPAGKAAVLVNNPAGYSLVSSRPAYVIPDGDLQTLLAAADRYRVRYVILDSNLPAGLLPVFNHPDQQPRLTLVARVDGALIFSVNPS